MSSDKEMHLKFSDYARAARVLMEIALSEWLNEHPDEAGQLLEDLSTGRRSLDLVSTAHPEPCVMVVAADLNGLRDHQVLVQFAADKSGLH